MIGPAGGSEWWLCLMDANLRGIGGRGGILPVCVAFYRTELLDGAAYGFS